MRFHLMILLSLVAVSAPHLAGAQPAGAQAQVLFDQGIVLMDAGKFGEACAAFDASDKLEPAISTLLNRADCRERNHQYATAWGLFLEAERQSRAATDPATQQLHLVAIEHAAKLEPRLSKLTVNVSIQSRIDGLQIVRGTDVVDLGAWNHPLPIDGGRYTITARAANHDAWSTEIEVGPEGDTKAIEVPRLKRSPVQLAAKRAKLPYLLGGGSVVLLGTGLVFELSAQSTYAASRKQPDDAKQTSLWRSANNKRYVAEGLAVAGFALAGVAVWRYLRHGTVETPAQFSVVPMVDGDQAGFQVFGRY